MEASIKAIISVHGRVFFFESGFFGGGFFEKKIMQSAYLHNAFSIAAWLKSAA